MSGITYAPLSEVSLNWPKDGRHILATYDAQTIVVYQAYKPSIANYAVKHQKFGGDWSYQRMSWIKPNFLWMMFRSGWGTKENQESTLAITLLRSGFEEILRRAAPTSFKPELYATEEQWQAALAATDVRLQWDPDHGPRGNPLERRAIQLGMKGNTLKQFATEWLVEVTDISAFVEEQRTALERGATAGELLVPAERVYRLEDVGLASRVGVSKI